MTVMPRNSEKENNISKNQLICDIVNNTHKFLLNIAEEKKKRILASLFQPHTPHKTISAFPCVYEFTSSWYFFSTLEEKNSS